MRARRAVRARPCRSRWCRSSSATGAATAATSCTSGSSCCSSAWPRPRRFKDVRDVALQPGQSATRRRQGVHVRQADRRAARGAERAPRADLARRRAARRRPARMHTSKDYFPSQDPSLGPISRFFDGESTTEVALDTSLDKDTWAAVGPDIAKLRPRLEEGDRLFANAARRPLGRGVQPVPRARAARADRQLREQPAAGALPVRGQPDGHLDLARRADRDARRRCSPAGRRRAG